MEFWKLQVEPVLVSIGLTLQGIVVGAFASFTALQFWKGLESRKERWATFLGGWGLAAWGSAPLREWLELKPSIDVLLILLIGLFGMALGAELVNVIRETDWKAHVKSIIDFVLRRKSGGE